MPKVSKSLRLSIVPSSCSLLLYAHPPTNSFPELPTQAKEIKLRQEEARDVFLPPSTACAAGRKDSMLPSPARS